jgi:hypothetical protein
VRNAALFITWSFEPDKFSKKVKSGETIPISDLSNNQVKKWCNIPNHRNSRNKWINQGETIPTNNCKNLRLCKRNNQDQQSTATTFQSVSPIFVIPLQQYHSICINTVRNINQNGGRFDQKTYRCKVSSYSV